MKYTVETGFRCHDIHTKFHKDWFKYSNVVRGNTHTDSKVIS
jgi:hypothetical protein